MPKWKTIYIDGEETNYEVSDDGQIRNTARNKKLRLQVQQGYMYCTLSVKKRPKRCSVHRLVAKAFIPNPENKPYVNHKDGCRTNNHLSNLEWATPSENTRDAVAKGLFQNGRNRPVIQYSMDGQKMMNFPNITTAAKETGCSVPKIIMCCQRKRRSTNNYQWRYACDKQDVVRIEPKWSSGNRVAQCDDDWNIIAVYDSYVSAAKAVSGTSSAISRICSGTNQHHKGYRWKIVEEIVQDEI